MKWTEKHQQEALRRTYEIAAERVAAGDELGAEIVASEPFFHAVTEKRWRSRIARAGLSAGFDTARIDREVRRVDRLARAVLVRETGWRARDAAGHVSKFFAVHARAADLAATWGGGGCVFRVTRIRRAS